MRRIEVHPLSLLIGAACAVAVSFAASPAQSPVTALAPNAHRIAIVGPVTIDGIYDPREAVVIREGTPFTVPTDRILVLTGAGAESFGGLPSQVVLRVDGAQEFIVPLPGNGDGAEHEASVRPIPAGFTVSGGSTITADNSGGPSGRAWGYLVDA